jgi:hypothetical protein
MRRERCWCDDDFFFRNHRPQWRWSMGLIERIEANFRVSAFFSSFWSTNLALYVYLCHCWSVVSFAINRLNYHFSSDIWIWTWIWRTYWHIYQYYLVIHICFKWEIHLIRDYIIIINKKSLQTTNCVCLYRRYNLYHMLFVLDNQEKKREK